MTQIEAHIVEGYTEETNKWIKPITLVCKVHNHNEDPLVINKDNAWWVTIFFGEQRDNTRVFYDCMEARCYLKGIEMGIKHIEYMKGK
jgi:hypothetical protein